MIRWTPLLLVACVHATAPAPIDRTPALRVWIDADPSVGVEHRDVDDGVALLQAFGSPELDVVAVSTVFGNAPLEQADPIGRELVARWSPDTPVHTGASAAGTTVTPAMEALVAALEREKLTILVLGPATNVATVLHHRPDLAPKIREVVAVAGRTPGTRFTTGTTNTRAHRDFNFEQDPGAFQTILDAGVPLTLEPFEISRQVEVDAAFLDRLAPQPATAELVEAARGWLQLWTDTFSVDFFNPFDTLAVGHLVRPELERCAPGFAAIEVGPDDRTETAMQGDDVRMKPYLHVRPDGPGRAVRWCHTVDAQGFLADLRVRLMRGGGA